MEFLTFVHEKHDSLWFGDEPPRVYGFNSQHIKCRVVHSLLLFIMQY